MSAPTEAARAACTERRTKEPGPYFRPSRNASLRHGNTLRALLRRAQPERLFYSAQLSGWIENGIDSYHRAAAHASGKQVPPAQGEIFPEQALAIRRCPPRCSPSPTTEHPVSRRDRRLQFAPKAEEALGRSAAVRHMTRKHTRESIPGERGTQSRGFADIRFCAPPRSSVALAVVTMQALIFELKPASLCQANLRWFLCQPVLPSF